MNIKPLLFSAPMIIALLDGRKTQTRRMCPVGNYKKGDLIWVKETYRLPFGQDSKKPGEVEPEMVQVLYEATWKNQFPNPPTFKGKIRPSIFMCRWMSRITLEITKVRTEPLKKISIKDCYAEGIAGKQFYPEMEFKDLWNSINGHLEGGNYKDNPWVTVLEFKTHKMNIDQFLEARAA